MSAIASTTTCALGTATVGHGVPSTSTSISSDSDDTGRKRAGRANIDSAAAEVATTTSYCDTASTSGAMPAVGRNEPSSPNSAINAHRSAASTGTIPSATNKPTAIAKSMPAPPLRSPPPAKLIVMRRNGHSKPLDNNAARTRSRDSRHPSSGSPTTVKPGSPFPTCASTDMGVPRVPKRVADRMAAYMCCSLWVRVCDNRLDVCEKDCSFGNGHGFDICAHRMCCAISHRFEFLRTTWS